MTLRRMRTRSGAGLWVLVLGLLAGAAAAVAAPPQVTRAPPIAPPATRANPFVGDLSDLARHGYVQQECFFESARARPLSKPDDRLPASRAPGPVPYRSRMIVFRPRDPKRFNGVAVVEWLNVSSGHDINVGWGLLQDEILRGGYAFVVVDAQVVGLDHLKRWDPARYGALRHPDPVPPPRPSQALAAASGEASALAAAMRQPQLGSFTVFSEAAEALRARSGLRPLGPLKVRQVIAYGNSQSAYRLTTFVSEHPRLALAYDAYIIHAGVGRITNPKAKVFALNSENEAPTYVPIRGLQPGPDSFAYWEVAGTAHMPARSLSQTLILTSVRDNPNGALTDSQARWAQSAAIAPTALAAEWAGNAILRHTTAWVAAGKRPPPAAFLEMEPGAPSIIARDAYGNARGGVRYPHVQAPLGRYWLNRLFPAIDPFDGEKAGTPGPGPADVWDEPTLAQLYPTHATYVASVARAADAAVSAGHLLSVDAEGLKAQARAAPVP